MADPDQVEAAAERIEAELGPIDVWVNNAMTSVFAPFTEVEPEEFRRVTEVAYLGFVYGTRAALRRMLPRDHGTIVQVGSALAYRGIPLQSAYCGAKHAIQGFTESVRAELYHDRSRVWLTMVQMPALNTPQFDLVLSRLPNRAQPVPPIYQPEVAARAVVWAATHRRRELRVGASTAATLLANTVAPGPLDRYLGRTGYRSQQTDRPRDPDRPANLWAPVPGDHGAHGRFDDRAHDRSVQSWAATHRGRVALPALHALIGGALLLAPGRLLRRVGDPADRRARLLARVLGARHLGQAVALAAADGRVAGRLGAAVDGLHGASMVALGLAVRRHRVAAMSAAAAAGALAALELTEAADG